MLLKGDPLIDVTPAVAAEIVPALLDQAPPPPPPPAPTNTRLIFGGAISVSSEYGIATDHTVNTHARVVE